LQNGDEPLLLKLRASLMNPATVEPCLQAMPPSPARTSSGNVDAGCTTPGEPRPASPALPRRPEGSNLRAGECLPVVRSRTAPLPLRQRLGDQNELLPPVPEETGIGCRSGEKSRPEPGLFRVDL
jgi:hypothetical protein